jgi:hypothetical protein
MALGLIPSVIADQAQAAQTITRQLQAQPQAVALIDLESLPKAFKHVLHLAEQLAGDVRGRVILLRHQQGPVWNSDRAWIKQLGFAGLFAEVDAQAMLAAPDELPALIARLTQVKPLSAMQLQSYFAAMNARPDPLTLRGLIRAHCHMDAESLARAMLSGVKSIDRSHRLTTHRACLIGTEAVSWLRKQFNCSTQIALQLGQALLQLGLMQHVVHEHDFENKDFFYRLDATDSTTSMQLGSLMQDLMRDVSVKDRTYLGTNYPQCWVGSEAVHSLHTSKKLARHEAENLLNRLMGYGLIEHVAKEHRVKDGNFYYRFI